MLARASEEETTPSHHPVPPEHAEALKKRGFELLDFIAKGAYGHVWRATQTSLNRHVAIKFLNGQGMKDAANRKRFDRERFLLARLDHPSIPYILTSGSIKTSTETIPYIAMQYVQGTRLSDILADRRKLSTTEALPIFYNILSALECAHKNKIIHRDVAPDNIIVGEFSTFLIDFSIGIQTTHTPGLTRTTEPGERVGRANYASPEQFKDSSKVDDRTDIYSAGIVLFETLTGHTRIKPHLIEQDLNNAPRELCNIIKTACAPNRDNRYPTVEAFTKALKSLFRTPTIENNIPSISICPNNNCSSAFWSPRGYFRGPRIEKVAAPYCNNCGTKYIKYCQRCGTPFTTAIADLLHRKKSEQDSTSAHCETCGDLIFKIPTCMTCNSLLQRGDFSLNTKDHGCAKCNKKPPTDDDLDNIPF
ncbi:serine/threonine protein kinase [Corallococcus exiguus]|uniref:serine/threonine-protein kinase n=1 Tax=Corallococcus exiguus TaxID=83462 RepID=UPI00155FA197|nr:serine/threonine-protein kinase [Corallococcus exiguus]NRD65464.1 serine/threonine protein kinase [Corallococcus exiguus]